jgi:hypothetical protein
VGVSGVFRGDFRVGKQNPFPRGIIMLVEPRDLIKKLRKIIAKEDDPRFRLIVDVLDAFREQLKEIEDRHYSEDDNSWLE